MEMQMDLETLIKLLQNFHEELTICLENKQAGEFPDTDEMADPILLGDFIVDTYNNYLASTKSACEHPVIQTLPEMENLIETNQVDYDIRRGVGKLPRLQKMREVAFATKQLLTVLEGMVETEKSKTQSEIVGVMTLLENLGEQIEKARVAIRESPEEGGQSIRRLVEEYNRHLVLVLETKEDTVLTKMFSPLEPVVDESTSYQDKLSELRLAQSGLLSYLKKMDERLGIQMSLTASSVEDEHERRRRNRR
jgi:hypothetical protein